MLESGDIFVSPVNACNKPFSAMDVLHLEQVGQRFKEREEKKISQLVSEVQAQRELLKRKFHATQV